MLSSGIVGCQSCELCNRKYTTEHQAGESLCFWRLSRLVHFTCSFQHRIFWGASKSAKCPDPPMSSSCGSTAASTSIGTTSTTLSHFLVSFLSVFNDIVWDAKGSEELCENNSKRVEEYARRFPRGHWSPNIPLYLCPRRGQSRSKEGGRTTIHSTASDDNVQLRLKMVISVNQLSLYGAAAGLIKDLPDDQRAQGNLLRQIRWNKKFLLNLLLQKYKPMKSDRETYCKITSEDLKKKKLPEDQKSSKLCSEASLNLVEVGQFFNALPSPNGAKNQSLWREHASPRDEKEHCAKGWIESDARFGPVSDTKSLQDTRKIQRWS